MVVQSAAISDCWGGRSAVWQWLTERPPWCTPTQGAVLLWLPPAGRWRVQTAQLVFVYIFKFLLECSVVTEALIFATGVAGLADADGCLLSGIEGCDAAVFADRCRWA